MNAFKFQAPTKVLFEVDGIRNLGNEVATFAAKRALVVCDDGIKAAGLLEPVKAALTSAGIDFEIFADVEPNPTDKTIAEGGRLARHMRAHTVIAVGGGSPIDAAKGIAVLATNEGDIEPFCGAGADPWSAEPLPVIAIPTTAGTGAEVSAAAMINLPHLGRKMDIFGASILPKVALLDPSLTVSLPPHLTAWTGIDALSHAIEAYVCVRANPISDAIAEHAIQLVATNLRQAYKRGDDIDARGNMLVASTMAVIAASNAGGLGVIHSLAQTLGGYYNLPHGLTIAVCFTHGMVFNSPFVLGKYARFAALMGVETREMTIMDAAEAGIAAVQALNVDVAITDDMQSLGVRQEDIPRLAALAMLDGCTPTNPRPLMTDDFVEMFNSMYEGGTDR